MKILIVDDTLPIRKLLVEIFEAWGHQCIETDNGHSGLELFKGHQSNIFLVVTDQEMDGMDGLKLSEEIRSLCPDVPILMATGHPNLEYLRKLAFKVGVNRVVSKPFDRTVFGQVSEMADKAKETFQARL